MKLISLILFAFIVFVFFVRYLEATGIFYPSRTVNSTPADINLNFHDIYFKTSDGIKLNGWFVLADENAPTVLFFHGNAGDIGDRLEKILLLNHLKANIFIIDYRGYGRSEGRPSEAGLYRDALGAYDYLIEQRNISPQKIVVYGTSLGGVPAIDLASQKEIGGLIIESSFSNAADMCRIIYPFIPTFLLQSRMDNVGKIKNVKAPKLFFHSQSDEIVPMELGRKVFDKAKEPKRWVSLKGGHNVSCEESKETYRGALKEFLEDIRR